MRKDLFRELVESAEEMSAVRSGRQAAGRHTSAATLVSGRDVDVAALRRRFRLSQAKFAALLGISINTLQNWEQGRRRPEGPARVLLRVAAAHPDALLDVTGQVRKRRGSASAA